MTGTADLSGESTGKQRITTAEMHPAYTEVQRQLMMVMQGNIPVIPLRESLQQPHHTPDITAGLADMHPPRPGIQQGGKRLRLTGQKF